MKKKKVAKKREDNSKKVSPLIKVELETEVETIEQLEQVLNDLKEIKEVRPDIQIKIRVRLT